ncbi:MAG: carboxyvinyl-carboxyphosphonate phosphorylmutase [Rhodospirillales bacterium CG15_BIG_FIL_POST_REV_8_21_14_020_66_15]|nr:MAG: carboxyvinyl-carboxyphosphonate phosphorylmutase [Rhodospirillales bacterium CG15_BIG_FIL_POST_REV_8_21_14_020_66_15]
MRPTTRLRELLKAKETLIVPGCYDAMTAKIVEMVGFPAAYMTGYGTSLALLGMPDAGLATMTEMHLNARYIAGAVKVPVIADSDNGYGNAINVVRCVRDYIQTGVAAIHIEDQAIPKRCGHVAGRQVIPMAEAVGKYRAARDVRDEYDPDFVLIARTDARGAVGGSLGVAIERANAYLQAGADVAFVEGPTTRDEVQRICEEVEGPVLYNQTGVSPRLTAEEMNQLGIALTIFPGVCMRATMKAVYEVMTQMKARGPLVEAELFDSLKGHPAGDFHSFAGFDQIRKWEEAYLDPAELEKYAGTVGYQPETKS